MNWFSNLRWRTVVMYILYPKSLSERIDLSFFIKLNLIKRFSFENVQQLSKLLKGHNFNSSYQIYLRISRYLYKMQGMAYVWSKFLKIRWKPKLQWLLLVSNDIGEYVVINDRHSLFSWFVYPSVFFSHLSWGYNPFTKNVKTDNLFLYKIFPTKCVENT